MSEQELTGPDEETDETAETEESDDDTEESANDEPDDDELLTPEMSQASPEPSHGIAPMHTPVTHGERRAMEAKAEAAKAAAKSTPKSTPARVVKPAKVR